MLNYTLNNINKTSYYILDNKNSLNINMTPFLFCSRNSIFLLDVLKHIFLLKKSLYFFEKIFLERNRVMFLMENKENELSLINLYLNKYKLSVISFLNTNNYKNRLKYNYQFLKYILNLKIKFNKRSYRFSKKFFNLKFFKLKVYMSLYFNLLKIRFNNFLLNTIVGNSLEFFDFVYIFSYLIKYKNSKYLSNILLNFSKKINKFNLYKDLLEKYKIYDLNIKNKFSSNKIIKGRFFNLYEVNFKIFFKFYSYMIKLKKWLLFYKKFNNKIYIKKCLYLKNYIKLLNINILNFYNNKIKFYSLISPFKNNGLNFNNSLYKNMLYNYKYKFIENRFYFWFNAWLNGGITNFYGLKKTYKSRNEHFKKINYLPDFFVYFNLEKKDLFLSELFLYEIPTIGFSSFDMNPFFFTYYIPTSNKNISIYEFYFSLFLESSFRSLILDTRYYN